MEALGRKRYPAEFDPIASIQWFLNSVLPNPLIYFSARTENAFAISHLHANPFRGGRIVVDIMFICADHGAMWEAVELGEASIAWARDHNAKAWQISSDTDIDLGPIARRLGCTEISPRYVLELA